MAINKETIKKLRKISGAGIMDCKSALLEAGSDLKKALEVLRKKGLAAIAKRMQRETREGAIFSYVHRGRIGVLVEINCETDFVTRNEEFKKFGKDIAMQIAASHPLYIKKEDVPQEVVSKEKEVLKAQIDKSKGEDIVNRILEGRLKKFYEQVCLLEQAFIKNPDIKVNHCLGELAAKVGENIVIKRFVRYEKGEI
ncbi:MAG: translation elongation factor Ts [Candidatus Omnitrophica bacterium 4484_213]|nr:MAG: translation elongation factor Ts [Candidatus Omnitrophica bacterium 4484_213]